MNLTSVVSTNIAKIGYEKGNLLVEIKGGNQYRYDEVPESVYQSFMSAPSKGKFFSANIKGKYATTKI